MKKFFAALFGISLFALASCGGGSDMDGSFSVDLSFDTGVEPTSLKVDVCGEDGLSFASAQMQAGKNDLPDAAKRGYLQCELPEAFDCPVVYSDGTHPVSLSVRRAEQNDDGEFLHSFTVFLKNSDGKDYQLQICTLEEDGSAGLCKIADFAKGSAALSLADGTYSVEVRAGSAVAAEREITFTFGGSARFCVFDLKEA